MKSDRHPTEGTEDSAGMYDVMWRDSHTDCIRTKHNNNCNVAQRASAQSILGRSIGHGPKKKKLCHLLNVTSYDFSCKASQCL